MLRKLAVEYLKGLDSIVRLLAMGIAFTALTAVATGFAYLLNWLFFGSLGEGPLQIWVHLLLFPLAARFTIAAGDLTAATRESRRSLKNATARS